MKISLAIGLAAALTANTFAQPVGTWRRLSPAGGPNGATFSGMIFDSNRGVLVAWDQINRWEWDGTRWAIAAGAGWGNSWGLSRAGFVFDPSSSSVSASFVGTANNVHGMFEWPTGDFGQPVRYWGAGAGQTQWNERGFAAAAIDPQSGRVVRVGPTSPPTALWNIRNWNGGFPHREINSQPAIRNQPALAYDRLFDEFVLFGGSLMSPSGTFSPPIFSGLTWALGSTYDWYVTAFTGPAPRYGHAMAFDASRGRTIMFGGITNGTPDNTDMYAWEWDGIAWIRGSAGPVPRVNAAMVYDSANSRILMFGGSPIAEPSASMTDLWEYRVPTAPRMLNQPRNIRALEGEPVRMEITLAPDATLRQPRWRKAGTAMADAPGYAGTTSPALFIEAARFADAGGYEFLIRNDVGTAISDPIFLTVLCKADADRSGFVDSDDFVAFTEAFERGCVSVGFGAELPDPNCKARADFDYSGFVDSDDFVGYIEAFSAGC